MQKQTNKPGEIDIQTPRVFLPALKGYFRYIGLYGGRGSGKSHFFAELLIERCLMKKTEAVCIREIQKSLSQSVKKLLEIKIEKLGVGEFFTIQDTVIKAKNGSLLVFVGMQNHTSDSIKSLEGFDLAWVEEAQSLSQRSLDLLRPTIRKEKSEIWFSWNPNKSTDPVDSLLRGDNQPKNSIVIPVNYTDNPWFPDVLKEEMEYDRDKDKGKYSHVWLGQYQKISNAIVFRNWEVKDFTRPPGTIYRMGADWGFANDPTVLVRFSVEGNTIYIDYEAVMVGCEIVNTPDLFRRVPESEKWFITADSARPETISYMRNHGFPKINAASKGAGSIDDGIEFLRSYSIVVHTRCTESIAELSSYSYKIDPMTDEILPVFEDKNNHCIAEGVLIETEFGLKSIESVTTDDKVLTRNGYRRVLWAGITDVDRDILRVETTGGVLYCTPEHKVYTVNKGFVSAEALSYNDGVINTIKAVITKQEHADMEINLQQTNTPRQNIVRGRVLTVTVAGKASNVYDITVESDHEFFANGVLVHNCIDALRYACEGIRKMNKKQYSTIEYITADSTVGY